MSRGLFIVLEGVEGAGKSTQARALSAWLAERGVPHTLAREPGGTPVGEAIRGIVLDKGQLRMPPETELLLIVAARAAFVGEVVRPALDRGEMVLSDRFDLSTIAYQGFGRGLDLEEIRRINRFATGGLRPDLLLILDLEVETGMSRKRGAGAGDRIEREGFDFLSRVREGYQALAVTEEKAVLVDAGGSPEAVQQKLRAILMETFPETLSA